ncbi:MAG: alanine dehydrogenase [Bacteroidales bacterium]|nr:alanine dehydrogenase [Bacteroidales bacterium]
MRIGIIREGKVPPDKRVPFTPEQCRHILDHMPGLEVVVQPSPIRCFPDEEYIRLGIPVVEDLSACDVLMGVKEVPLKELIPGKTYFFFSHTIKKQPYNRELLREVVRKGIRLIDYEVLTDRSGMRIIGFGRFAGVVGAYNGIRAWGLRHRLWALKPAWQCRNMEEMLGELAAIDLPAIRITLTGGGRVAGGAVELMNAAGIHPLPVDHFLANEMHPGPVYVRLDPGDYNEHKEGKPFDMLHFFNNPWEYRGTFRRFLPHTDLLIGAAFWDPKAPVLFSPEDTLRPDFRVKVIADITCDIDGSIPTTLKASTIGEPFYDIHPHSFDIKEPFSCDDHISVMAVDNLPCELPADASYDFGKNLTEKVLPFLAGEDPDQIIERASITRNGRLTEKFAYLRDFLEGRE